MTYKHLSLEERERIFGFSQLGLSLQNIAKKLKRNVGTISRELTRNKTGHGKVSKPNPGPSAVRILLTVDARAVLDPASISWSVVTESPVMLDNSRRDNGTDFLKCAKIVPSFKDGS